MKMLVRNNILTYFKWTVVAACMLLTACASTPNPSDDPAPKSTGPYVAKRYSADAEIETLLRREYLQWKGTRHHLGGNDGKGIDCSGFVKAVYKAVFNIDLPRSTRAQVRQGRPVAFEELQAGDLVFFKPPSYPRHVGIFLSGSEFVHASKNRGVTLSKIDQYYWEKYYWTARRILPESRHP